MSQEPSLDIVGLLKQHAGRNYELQSEHINPANVRALRTIGFDRCFGRTPADWFLSFSLDRTMFCPNGDVRLPDGDLRHVMVEHTKGSVFHFESHFPDAPLLSAWARHLRRQAAMIA